MTSPRMEEGSDKGLGQTVNEGARKAFRPFQGDDRLIPLDPRAQKAIVFSGRALADANEAAECGNAVKAEKLYRTAQYWLDRYNKLTGEA